MSRPRAIKLMADYECFPLWEVEAIGNIDPTDLPIDDGLRADLLAWARRFDDGLNWADPARSVVSPEEQAAFEAEGLSLADRLRDALGPEWTVIEHI